MSSSRSDGICGVALRACMAVALASPLASGCEPDGRRVRFGENITGLRFELFDESEGIHPSTITLGNPRNPFRFHPIGEQTRFEILAYGGNAGAFYAWATLLARAPTGEHQFFTAAKLHDIAVSGELDTPEEVCRVTRMAGRAYQAVLDGFPGSVSYLEDGTSYALAPLAYRGIEALGLTVQGGWVLAGDGDGHEVVVRMGGGPPAPTDGEEAVDPCAP